jgi:hypothetical protein
MRRWTLPILLAFCARAGDVIAQQITPADTTNAPAQPGSKPDSAKADARAADDTARHHKILWWTGGIALFILLNLLISDRPSKSE